MNARPTHYRQHVLASILKLLAPIPVASRALDFGAGDGWFSNEIVRAGLSRLIAPVDVFLRKKLVVPLVLFDGERLPFKDSTFELSYAVDVLHHCPVPAQAIAEMLRCTAKYCLIKDHTYSNSFEKAELAILDELGNRRFGIPSPHQYQYCWTWDDVFKAYDFERVSLIHPAPCHTGLLGRLTNHLQFLALWRRRAI
jgi:SAM-dependent methyltransferase